MAFREAYEATSEGVKLNEDIFTKGKKLETTLTSKIDEVQIRLKEMGAAMKEELGAAELTKANKAIQQELSESVPDNFRAEYEATKDGAEAAELIQEHILAEVDRFVTQKVEGIV